MIFLILFNTYFNLFNINCYFHTNSHSFCIINYYIFKLNDIILIIIDQPLYNYKSIYSFCFTSFNFFYLNILKMVFTSIFV